ncbi:hypothetical protein [Kitasatospora viridis]|uniref:Uncharacterized protein n=1 Tax=Kitasatospora viridis TaxID=281105 RepID=A0A561UCY3_9ACTN|nr:hypothetical protein [Kitasatospora viridis]TWF97232.1 hypothetical protein FHX73_111012 [Kitasatospora viridis]
MGDTLKVTDQYLDETVLPEVTALKQSMIGTNAKDPDGKVVVNHVNDFAGGAGNGLPSDGGNGYTVLMAGNFTEGSTVSGNFKSFAGSIQGQFKAISGAVDKIVLGIVNAKRTFDNAEDDALTSAQMFTILSGSPPTGINPPNPPKP